MSESVLREETGNGRLWPSHPGGMEKGRRRGAAGSIFLSLTVHLLALGLLTFMPKPASPSLPLVSYPVSWVSLQSPEQEQTEVETAPSPPLPPVSSAPPPSLKEAEKPPVAPPKITLVMPAPPAPELSLPDPAPVEVPPQETAALPVVPSPPSPVSATDPPRLSDHEKTGEAQTASVPTMSLKGEGALGAGGPFLNHPYYFQGIQNKISAHWTPPSDLFASGQQGEVMVVIGFVVQQNGQIRHNSVVIEKSSGNPFWDASALRAVYNANPLLPLPKGITEELHVHFEFSVRLQS